MSKTLFNSRIRVTDAGDFISLPDKLTFIPCPRLDIPPIFWDDVLRFEKITIHPGEKLGAGSRASVFTAKVSGFFRFVCLKICNLDFVRPGEHDDITFKNGYEELNYEVIALNTLHKMFGSVSWMPTLYSQGFVVLDLSDPVSRTGPAKSEDLADTRILIPAIITICPVGVSLKNPFRDHDLFAYSTRKEFADFTTEKIIGALKPLHRKGFVHGDISLGNIIFNFRDIIIIDWACFSPVTDHERYSLFDFSKTCPLSHYSDLQDIAVVWFEIVFGPSWRSVTDKIHDGKLDPELEFYDDSVRVYENLKKWIQLSSDELIALDISSLFHV